MEPKILIVGCGGIGITYMHILLRALPETHVFAVCRSNRETALASGFRLNSGVWGCGLQMRPVIVASVSEAVARNSDGFEYIIISTKCLPPVTQIPDSIWPAVSEKTAIVLFHNGIGIEFPFASLYPSNPIISAVIYTSSIEVSPAVAEHGEIEGLHLGTYPSTAPQDHKNALYSLALVFIQGGATTTVHEDIQAERWSKAVINTTWNPITALTRSGDTSFLASHPHTIAFVRALMLEIAAVAQSYGYSYINEEFVDNLLARITARNPPGIRYSMVIDATMGRPMEVDAIIGNVVALATEQGIATPLLQSLYLLINGLNNNRTACVLPLEYGSLFR